MTLPFVIIAALTLAGAIGAVSFRSLVHCALALTVSFAGLAGLYLLLDAQFVGFAQVLIYIGAVAILIVFAILLTRGGQGPDTGTTRGSWWIAGIASASLLALISVVMLSSGTLQAQTQQATSAAAFVAPTVRQIGDALMTKYILTLQVIGLVLTVALIGGVIIALREKDSR